MVTRKKKFPGLSAGGESRKCGDLTYKFSKRMIENHRNDLTFSTFNDVVPNQHAEYPYAHFQKPDDLGVLQSQAGTYETKEVKVYNPLTQQYQTFESKSRSHVVGFRDKLSFNHILARGEGQREDIVANSSKEAVKDNYLRSTAHERTLKQNPTAFDRRPSLFKVNGFTDESKELYLQHSRTQSIINPGTTSLSRVSARKSITSKSYKEYILFYILFINSIRSRQSLWREKELARPSTVSLYNSTYRRTNKEWGDYTGLEETKAREERKKINKQLREEKTMRSQLSTQTIEDIQHFEIKLPVVSTKHTVIY